MNDVLRKELKNVTISRFPPLEYECNEALNTLCTNLSYCGDDIQTILFTSRYTREGKSSLTMYIMRTLASLGKRVVLVDTDLRRSVMAKRFRLKFDDGKIVGLTEYLAGVKKFNESDDVTGVGDKLNKSVKITDIVYKTNVPNAYIVPAGRDAINSLQLLASARFGDLIERLRESFDVILVDSPPAGVIVDAVEVARYCDGAVIVVAHNRGRKQDISDVAASISQTGCRVLGAVLNGVNLDSFQNRKYYYRSGRYANYYRNDYYRSAPKREASVDKRKKTTK